MHVAVVQMSSQEDLTRNLERATALIAAAAKDGAELVALPENFAFMGDESRKREIAEELALGGDERPRGPIATALADAARAANVYVVAGGMPERSSDPARPYNTSALFAPDGRIAARYRKVHLFDVDLHDGTRLCESQATSAGDDAVCAEISTRSGRAIQLGMTVCYDVRFPELYRRLADLHARIITVPAAFTVVTGKDHWHVLLRARAIENQVFVLAPAQHGQHPRNRQTYGKSLIVDPWGDVLAQCAEGEGHTLARLDFERQDRVRRQLPSLMHRRLRGG